MAMTPTQISQRKKISLTDTHLKNKINPHGSQEIIFFQLRPKYGFI